MLYFLKFSFFIFQYLIKHFEGKYFNVSKMFFVPYNHDSSK